MSLKIHLAAGGVAPYPVPGGTCAFLKGNDQRQPAPGSGAIMNRDPHQRRTGTADYKKITAPTLLAHFGNRKGNHQTGIEPLINTSGTREQRSGKKDHLYPSGSGRGNIDAANHITGRSIYVDDIPVAMEGHALCKVFDSPFAHGKIRKIDVMEAEQLDGIVKIFSHRYSPARTRSAASSLMNHSWQMILSTSAASRSC